MDNKRAQMAPVMVVDKSNLSVLELFYSVTWSKNGYSYCIFLYFYNASLFNGRLAIRTILILLSWLLCKHTFIIFNITDRQIIEIKQHKNIIPYE